MNKNILIVRYGTIGDTIFASAFLRELRKEYPQARIDFLADKISEQVVLNCPYIDNICKINGKWKNIKYYFKMFKNYDTIYFLKNDSFLTICAFLSGVKNRIGFKIFRNKFLTKTCQYKENELEIECYLNLLKTNGIQVVNNKTEIWFSEQDTKKILPYLTDKPKVIIQAYSRYTQKNWIDEYWAEIIKFLVEKYDAKIYFAGGDKDWSNYEKLTESIKEIKKHFINLSGNLSIKESFALISKMDLFIGIDSGLIHAAAACDIPSILLNGPTSLKRWAPQSNKCTVISQNFSCSPCCLQTGVKKGCKNQTSKCMYAIKPEQIKNAISDKFEKYI